MSRPLVGITTCTDERGRWREGRAYHYIHAAYADALAQLGALPLYLPTSADPTDLAAKLDALLIPGGDDLEPPEPYAQPIPLDLAPRSQLDFDRAILAAMLERHRPMLGICYGAQLLALHHGGRLLYHLPVDVPDAGQHKLEDGDRHALHIEPDTHLARWLDPAPAQVNSLHHQGIAEPGAGLRVCARADDGVVEAIERVATPFCVGVQWHPETLADASSRALFAAFVEASGIR